MEPIEKANRRATCAAYELRFRLMEMIAIIEITAINGPLTNAPVIAASMDLSWVLDEKSSIAAIVRNKQTT